MSSFTYVWLTSCSPIEAEKQRKIEEAAAEKQRKIEEAAAEKQRKIDEAAVEKQRKIDEAAVEKQRKIDEAAAEKQQAEKTFSVKKFQAWKRMKEAKKASAQMQLNKEQIRNRRNPTKGSVSLIDVLITLALYQSN